MVTEHDWESDTWTHHTAENAARAAWREAVQVASQSNGTVVYHLVNGECSCKDYAKAQSNWCKHRIAAGMYKRATALVQRKLAQHANGASNGQVAAAVLSQILFERSSRGSCPCLDGNEAARE